MLPVSDSIGDEGYFGRANRAILCVWLYILSLKNSGVSWVRSKRCTFIFAFGNVMNVMCVLAGDIVSVVCRKASG